MLFILYAFFVYLLAMSVFVVFVKKGKIEPSIFLAIYIECSGIFWAFINVCFCMFTDNPTWMKVLSPAISALVLVIIPIYVWKTARWLPKDMQIYRDEFFS